MYKVAEFITYEELGKFLLSKNVKRIVNVFTDNDKLVLVYI